MQVTLSIPGQKALLFDLSDKRSDDLASIAKILEQAPKHDDGIPQERRAARDAGHKASVENASVFHQNLKLLADLDTSELEFVIGFARLLQFGEKGLCSDENWAIEAIKEVLYDVIFEGPAPALMDGPRGMLRVIANAYPCFLDTINNANVILSTYPGVAERAGEEVEQDA